MCEEIKRCISVPRASKLLGSPGVKLFQGSRGSESLLEVGEEKSWEAHAHSSLMFVSARIGGKQSRDRDVFAAAGPLSVCRELVEYVRWSVGRRAECCAGRMFGLGQVIGGGRCKWKLDLTCAKNPASVVERT
jgi:hypothetical protein